jgi:N-acetylmuramic acid 6-phosphate (MurNAc-6-P) etherase
MLLRLSAASRDEVRSALALAGGNVKLAVLLLRGCDPEKGQALLDLAHGELRAALQLMEVRGTDAA